MKRNHPYSIWWHPGIFFLDVLFHYIFYFFVPNFKLSAEYDLTNPSPSAKKLLKQIRQTAHSSYDMQSLGHIQKWSESVNCKIVQHTVIIPLESNILEQWSIPLSAKARELLKDNETENQGRSVEILFTFPLSLLNNKDDAVLLLLEDKPAKNGTFRLKDPTSIDMSTFLSENAQTPVLVYIHGGGLTMGSNADSIAYEFGCKPSIQAGGKPIILASLKYRLAPEHTFPGPLQDLLQGTMYIIRALQKNEDCTPNLNIVGPSAGGYWATILTMECQRKFPGLVRSALIMCPMMKPSCDSVSYFLSTHLYFPGTDWLRWCWQGYLGLPWTKAKPFPPHLSSLEKKRQHNANTESWAESPWRQDKVLERLIDPSLDLPSNFSEAPCPEVLVTTNEGDPLRDDGYALLKALKESHFPQDKLTHVHTLGSHHFGLMFDTKTNAMDQISNWWTNILFPIKSTNS